MSPAAGPSSTAGSANGPGAWCALSDDAAYQALCSHDARFDGRVYVGVRTTGIYCRPVCRVRTPRRENCRFFAHAAAAEQAGFRPCLRCRPELAPGWSHTDATHQLAQAGAQWLEHLVAHGCDPAMSEVAARLGITDRHFRRIFQAHYGVAPHAWVTTRRLLLAKQLLTDTPLNVQSVAAAAGFGSVRRLHAAFAQHYRCSPNDWRSSRPPPLQSSAVCTLRLGWRPPLDASALLRFLADRAVPSMECVLPGLARDDGSGSGPPGPVWCRTLALQHGGRRMAGWWQVRWCPERHQVEVQVAPSLVSAVGSVALRVRRALDLDADPVAISQAWATAGLMRSEGLRVPGAVDAFETTVRIVLGQQVSVAAATTLADRLVRHLGERLVEPLQIGKQVLTHVFPTPQALAQADPASLGALGIVRTRVHALQALSRAVLAGLDLEAPVHPAATLEALGQLPGFGPWTLDLVALRVLHWPDAFAPSDLAVRRALGGISAAEAERWAEPLRPWRAYALMQLWNRPPAVSPVLPSTTPPQFTG